MVSGAPYPSRKDDISVETLDYIGGEGGYCEPVVVTYAGQQAFLLHQGYIDGDSFTHRVVDYPDQEGLELAFDEVQRRLTVDQGLDWREVSEALGFDDIDLELFTKARLKTGLIPWDQRRPGRPKTK